MNTVQLQPERLLELVGRFASCRVAVLGDFFLDRYLDVDPRLGEVSLETGKPAHQVVGVRASPGAAGTVTCNLAALGAGRLHAVGFTGDDGEGFELRTELERMGCSTSHLHSDPERLTPTYLKPRDVTVAGLAAEHSRYDTKNRTPTSRSMQEKIAASLEALLPDIDALIVMDQVEEPDCGAVASSIRGLLADLARRFHRVIFWADSRRWIRSFRGVIMKCNQFEAAGRDAASPDETVNIAELEASARELRVAAGAPVVVTRGADGMLVSDPEWTLVPGVAVEGEADPTGAGDSATAGAVLALCAGARLPEAALVGNLVASITVQQIGTTGVARPADLPPRLALWQQQQEQQRQQGQEEQS